MHFPWQAAPPVYVALLDGIQEDLLSNCFLGGVFKQPAHSCSQAWKGRETRAVSLLPYLVLLCFSLRESTIGHSLASD